MLFAEADLFLSPLCSYCGNSFADGSIAAPDSDCSKPCAGNLLQTCGGSSRLSIYQKASPAPTTTTSSVAAATSSGATITLANGWTSTGACLSDSPRLMSTDVYQDSAMTFEMCTSYCASKGFTQAGTSIRLAAARDHDTQTSPD